MSVTLIAATTVLYDGRALFNLTNADLNVDIGPYLTYVLFMQLVN